MSAPAVIRLEQIRVASPCTERWEDMTGDERSRHCAKCNLNVYNIGAMTRAEADTLLMKAAEGRVCVRFYRRADGTILTRDCPVGLARVRAGVRRSIARIAAALGLVAAGGATAANMENQGTLTGRLRDWRPVAMVAEWLVPSVPPMSPAVRSTWSSGMVMGEICVPTTPPSPPPSGNSTNPTSTTGNP